MALHRAQFPDLLFDATSRLRGWEESLGRMFGGAGYRELSPSLVMDHARTDARQDTVLLGDQGFDIGLRWDFTEALAKLLAARFAMPPPRICYRGPVFRRSENPWEPVERYEVGCERISPEEPTDADAPADRELFGLLLQVPKRVGLRHATVRVGYAALLKDALGLESIAPALANEVANAVAKKAAHRAHAALHAHPAQSRLVQHIECLLSGEFSRSSYAGSLVVQYTELCAAEHVLRDAAACAVQEQGQEHGTAVEVVVDLADVSGFHFYTGPTVRLWAPNAALELASGGRYDGLYAGLGKPWAAAGFCVRLSRLLELAESHPDLFDLTPEVAGYSVPPGQVGGA